MSGLSHPSLLARFGLCHSSDWPGVDFPPFLLVFLHHFLGDGNRPLPVLLFIVNQPRRNFGHILRIRKPTRAAWRRCYYLRNAQITIVKSLAQSDLWKETSIRSRARFLDVAIWAPSAKPSASRIRARLSAKKQHLNLLLMKLFSDGVEC